MDLDEWMKSGMYLPPVMRDFHDQKTIFKRIAVMVQRAQDKRNAGSSYTFDRMEDGLPNWMQAHIYVIDFFLWYMAKCGYTLQRSRQSFEFYDLEADLAQFNDQEREAFYAALEAEMKQHEAQP